MIYCKSNKLNLWWKLWRFVRCSVNRVPRFPAVLVPEERRESGKVPGKGDFLLVSRSITTISVYKSIWINYLNQLYESNWINMNMNRVWTYDMIGYQMIYCMIWYGVYTVNPFICFIIFHGDRISSTRFHLFTIQIWRCIYWTCQALSVARLRMPQWPELPNLWGREHGVQLPVTVETCRNSVDIYDHLCTLRKVYRN